jgi:diguanylate cyclase (GGDEF)-like protein
MRTFKLIYRLTVPGAPIILLAYVLLRSGLVAEREIHQLQLYTGIILAVGLVLSAWFHRSRIFFAFLVTSLSYAALVWLAPLLSLEHQAVLLNAITILFPANLLWLAFLRERGIVSPAGGRRMLVIAIQVIMVSVLMLPRFNQLAPLLDYKFTAETFSRWSRIAQPALAAFLITAVTLMIILARRYRAVESGFLWSLICVFIALRAEAASQWAAIYFGAAGLLLTIAVLETSYSMAYRDDLTRLPSRRALNEALLKLGQSYAIAMLDVDHFKKFNDTYGHAAGDQALQMVAFKLAYVSGGGKAYRYGGEEFAVIFPDTPAEEAFTYLDRMRRLIEQSRFVVRGNDRRGRRAKRKSAPRTKETNVTVSIGLAVNQGEQLPVEQVLRAADEALYKAKAKGRNCTVVARAGKPAKSADFSMRVLSVE